MPTVCTEFGSSGGQMDGEKLMQRSLLCISTEVLNKGIITGQLRGISIHALKPTMDHPYRADIWRNDSPTYYDIINKPQQGAI